MYQARRWVSTVYKGWMGERVPCIRVAWSTEDGVRTEHLRWSEHGAPKDGVSTEHLSCDSKMGVGTEYHIRSPAEGAKKLREVIWSACEVGKKVT